MSIREAGNPPAGRDPGRSSRWHRPKFRHFAREAVTFFAAAWDKEGAGSRLERCHCRSRVSGSNILSYECAKGVRGASVPGAGLKPAIGINKAPCGKEIPACDTVVSPGAGGPRRTAEARY